MQRHLKVCYSLSSCYIWILNHLKNESDQNITHDIFCCHIQVRTRTFKRVYVVHMFENVSSSILIFSFHEIVVFFRAD